MKNPILKNTANIILQAESEVVDPFEGGEETLTVYHCTKEHIFLTTLIGK